MDKIDSKIIGQLTQDKTFPDWWRSELISIPFFDDMKLPVIFMDFEPEHDLNFLDEADNALVEFFKLSSVERTDLSNLVYRYCTDSLDNADSVESDEQFRILSSEQAICEFVHPKEIYVTRRPNNDCDIYIQIACECDWEQEHGLQLVFRQGKKLIRVSEQDGHLTEADAFDIPDSEDKLLSQF